MTEQERQEVREIIIDFLEENGSQVGSQKVVDLTEAEMTDANLSALIIPSVKPATGEWVQTTLKTMMRPITNNISDLTTLKSQTISARNAANTAAIGAENVNASLVGLTVTITDRQGVSRTVTVGFDFYRTYTSIDAMNADAANVPEGKLVSIATTNPTSEDNAKIFQKTSQGTFNFLCDLDQASAAAWADWLENMKPDIEQAISTANSDHTIAVSDHTTAQSDHTTAQTDHSTAVSDHTQAGTDHNRADSDHAVASNDHTTADTDHTLAASDHQTAGTDHLKAVTDSETAESDHTRAEEDHTASTSATAQVNAAVSAANSAASNANAKAQLADSKATLANNAASNANEKAIYAQTQGDYTKEWNQHPPYIGDGLNGDLDYWYLWDMTTHQYIKGSYAKGDDLHYDEMTPEEYQRLVDDVRTSVISATIQEAVSAANELT